MIFHTNFLFLSCKLLRFIHAKLGLLISSLDQDFIVDD
jgi:hypothetical protein